MINRTHLKELPPYDRESLKDVAEAMGLRLVVLYGSWARWTPPPKPESDVDIAILGCPRDAFWDCYEALSKVFESADLDVVSLENADPLFRHEIMSVGELLAGDPDLFCEYRAYAYRDFTDSLDLRELEQVLYRKKMDNIKQQIHAPN